MIDQTQLSITRMLNRYPNGLHEGVVGAGIALLLGAAYLAAPQPESIKLMLALAYGVVGALGI